jgi:hypothetical protein
MEETIKKKTWHDVNVTGKWRLLYKVMNTQGPEAFGGFHLPVYPNPFTGEKTYLKNVDGGAKNGYLMDKLVINLNPDEDKNVFYLVHWLICHPDVRVKGVPKLDPTIIKKTKDNTQITLTCLDYVEIEEIEKEDFIDQVVGRISLNNGNKALGLEKVRHIMASLKLQYHDPRHTGMTEKKILRSKLKNYIRSSYENAQRVHNAIKNLEEAKEHYLFKEMIRHRVLILSNGMYKYNNAPVGTNFDTVLRFWSDHPEVKTSVLEELAPYLKD